VFGPELKAELDSELNKFGVEDKTMRSVKTNTKSKGLNLTKG
jgi:hypothetical protein